MRQEGISSIRRLKRCRGRDTEDYDSIYSRTDLPSIIAATVAFDH
jgi:hypothetical protein